MYTPSVENFVKAYLRATDTNATESMAREVYARCMTGRNLNPRMLEAVTDFRGSDVSQVMSRACLPPERFKELKINDEVYFTDTDPILRGIGKFRVFGKSKDGTPAIDYTGNGLWLISNSLFTPKIWVPANN
ncbi:MAG: hypothetical protein WCK29_01440 [archaeon]